MIIKFDEFAYSLSVQQSLSCALRIRFAARKVATSTLCTHLQLFSIWDHHLHQLNQQSNCVQKSNSREKIISNLQYKYSKFQNMYHSFDDRNHSLCYAAWVYVSFSHALEWQYTRNSHLRIVNPIWIGSSNEILTQASDQFDRGNPSLRIV